MPEDNRIEQWEAGFVDRAKDLIEWIKEYLQKTSDNSNPQGVRAGWWAEVWQYFKVKSKHKVITCINWLFSSSPLRLAQQLFIQLLIFVLGLLLLILITSPVFLNFNADGAVRFCVPWDKGVAVSEKTSVKMTLDWSKDKEYFVELSGGGRVKMNLIDPSKHTIDIHDGGTLHSFSLKYVNAALGIAAYIFGIIFLSMLLRGLCKANRRRRVLCECSRDFGKLLAASPNRAKHQEAFLQEIMNIYLYKKEE